MKKIVIIASLLVSFSAISSAQVPFHKGFNFSVWFEQPSAQRIQFTRFTKDDFINIKKLDCDHVRVPIHFFNMTGQGPDYKIDPLLFMFLDQVIDWAEDLDLYLILDNHSFDVDINTNPEILSQLIKVWKQVAQRYKDRSELIFYEILNEPHGIADTTWNRMQQTVVDSIRSIDKKHTIIIGPAGWNSYENLKYMPEYKDSNLIYTFHFYSPFLFTHQGASWVTPAMDIAGVPFPYDQSRMPDLPDELKGTWVEYLYNDYPEEGTEDWVKSQIDIAVDFSKSRNILLWCGEFGAYMPNSTTEDRARWLELVRTYFEENDISWTMWAYAGGFGIFEPRTACQFDYDVNIPIIEALGLNVPPQQEYKILPDTTGFPIYDDYIAQHIYYSSWTSSGTLNYYCDEDPAQGNFCIKWEGADLYNDIGFYLAPVKDLSYLADMGYTVNLNVKSFYKKLRFDIRFLDTKTDDPNDHPWRKRFIIDSTVCAWDGKWHQLQIPLSSFREHGAWDNDRWYEPEGLFDWTRIQSFEIVAEHHELSGVDLWIDDIKVAAPLTDVWNRKEGPETFALFQNFPNPFNSETTIMFKIPEPGDVQLKIYNVRGQEIFRVIKSEIMFKIPEPGDVQLKIYNVRGQEIFRVIKSDLKPGLNSISWNGTDFLGNQITSGVYVYKIVSGSRVHSGRMVLLR